ncbi:MAG: type II toxin-antitoxin system RelE/ParE family toxin [Thiomicrorhabdus sp.]|nr:type II toxin-antitoxin system RelE/ParE family toxin [Thiomicrorhabdus sp.]
MHKAEKLALDKAIKEIVLNPFVGELKIGDLAGVQVFKYKHNAQLYLLAYEFIENRLTLTFIEHGTHESFYRNLKR